MASPIVSTPLPAKGPHLVRVRVRVRVRLRVRVRVRVDRHRVEGAGLAPLLDELPHGPLLLRGRVRVRVRVGDRHPVTFCCDFVTFSSRLEIVGPIELANVPLVEACCGAI